MLLAAPAVSACGGSATTTSTTASRSPTAHAHASHAAVGDAAPARPATFVYRPRYELAAPLKDPAFAVLGGGSSTELDHIISFNPARGIVSAVGTLPRAQSEVAVTATGGKAYVVGGYDGTNWLNTILAWRPGSPVQVVGHLPSASATPRRPRSAARS